MVMVARHSAVACGTWRLGITWAPPYSDAMQEDEARIHATADLPPQLEGPSVWYGPEMARRQDWIHRLSSQEIAEVEQAARPWAGRELSGL